MPHLIVLTLFSIFACIARCQLHPDTSFTISHPFTSATQNYDTFGSAMLHSDTVVLTPHSPAHLLGALWAKKTNPHLYWEAEFSFRASGAERGGNGLAFWYSTKRGLGGNVFGSIDAWDGLGLFFDSNTGGRSTVRGHLNAGDVRYDSLADHVGHAFGSCPYTFRNPSAPIVVKVSNSRDAFKVTIDGNLCFETNQVLLQPGNYFGVSASTGDMPDHHQLFGFKVTPLEAAGNPPPNQHIIPDAKDRTPRGNTAQDSIPNDALKQQVDTLAKQLKDHQEETQLTLRRIEASIGTISRSIGSLSSSVTQIQSDIAKSGSSTAVVDSLQRLMQELKQIESALKEHIGGHVGVLSESLVGRGGFWKGIWMVVGVQAAGWILYETYRSKRKSGKKLL